MKDLFVAVSSTNPAKIAAVREAFEASFADQKVDVVALAVSSGVDEQPKGDNETLRGAVNRTDALVEALEADYYVSMEGGVRRQSASVNGETREWWECFGYVVVRCPGIGESIAQTGTIQIPDEIVRLIYDDEATLGAAMTTAFDADRDLPEKGGYFGFWTNGRMDRKEEFRTAVDCALSMLRAGVPVKKGVDGDIFAEYAKAFNQASNDRRNGVAPAYNLRYVPVTHPLWHPHRGYVAGWEEG